MGLVVIGALTLVAATLLVIFTMPSTGALIVTVSGPGGADVGEVRVIVDGALKCNQSPCRVGELSAGAHTVRVEAPGHLRPADRAVAIEAGGDAVLDFSLSKDDGQRTGVRVGAVGKGLRLFVDGVERGMVPITIGDLPAGEHSVRIEGEGRYEPWEQKVTVKEGELQELSPNLVAKKAMLTLTGGETAQGAEILLTCGDDQQLVLDLPKTIEIALDQDCRVRATREGFEPFVAKVEFAPGASKTTLVVDLREAGAAAGGGRIGGAASRAKGFIALSCIPPCPVLVDGRPVGRAPKRVSVPAGRHTVVFMHKKGRRTQSVTVRAGKTAMASAKF